MSTTPGHTARHLLAFVAWAVIVFGVLAMVAAARAGGAG